jgi:hypothetical protein
MTSSPFPTPGDEEKVSGDAQEVLGDDHEVIGNEEKVSGETQEVSGETDNFSGETQNVIGGTEEVSGGTLGLIGDAQLVSRNAAESFSPRLVSRGRAYLGFGGEEVSKPERLASAGKGGDATAFRVGGIGNRPPKVVVARLRQPWAEGCSPVGAGTLGRARFPHRAAAVRNHQRRAGTDAPYRPSAAGAGVAWATPQREGFRISRPHFIRVRTETVSNAPLTRRYST